MRIFKIEKDGRSFEFVNSSRNTRHGFAHDCTMFVDNNEYQKASCHYLNRAWEMYTYQSVALEAINQELQGYKADYLEDWKNARNISRLTKARREEFEKEFSTLDYVKTLQAVKNELKTKCFY